MPTPPASLFPVAVTTVRVCMAWRAASSGEVPSVSEGMLAALAPALDQTPEVTLRAVRCLGVCRRPVTVAVSAREGYTFVFGDLDAHHGVPAIAAFVGSYRQAAYGFVPWVARPELLRSRLVARIPSVLRSPQDGRPPA
jgi:predicted metal-binding protein